MLKLPEYARRLGISRNHAHALWARGELPHPATKIGPRTILVDVPDDFGLGKPPGRTVAYCRVSTANRKEGLETQKLRILEWAVTQNIKVDEVVTEIGSDMNERRKKLTKVLKDPTVTTIIVEHRERLTRFNFELVASALAGRQCEILVIDPEEIEDDLVRDITDFLTSVCARVYGQRSAKLKAQKITQALTEDSESS